MPVIELSIERITTFPLNFLLPELDFRLGTFFWMKLVGEQARPPKSENDTISLKFFLSAQKTATQIPTNAQDNDFGRRLHEMELNMTWQMLVRKAQQ